MTTAPDISKARSYRSLTKDADNVLATADSYVNQRWNPDLATFIDVPEENTRRIHFVNSATAIYYILAPSSPFNPNHISAYQNLDPWHILEFFLHNHSEIGWVSKKGQEWNPYTTAWCLRAISRALVDPRFYKPIEDPTSDTRLTVLFDMIASEANRLLSDYLRKWPTTFIGQAQHLEDFAHPYIAATALSALAEFGDSLKILSNHVSSEEPLDNRIQERCSTAHKACFGAGYVDCIQSVLQTMSHEFYRQLAMHVTSTISECDIASLVFSFVTMLNYGQYIDVSTHAVNNLIFSSIPDHIIDLAMQQIMKAQDDSTGLWATTSPILSASRGLVGASSVEIGLMLALNEALLRQFPYHIENYIALLRYFLRHYSGNIAEVGWQTEIARRNSGRQTWFGVMAYSLINVLGENLRYHSGTVLLADFAYGEPGAQLEFEKLTDYRGLKETIKRHFIVPWSNVHKRGRVAELNSKSRYDRLYTAILYGPPGTGKTTIVEVVAKTKGWRFLQVGPSDFLVDGQEGIFARANDILQRLLLIEKAVVLFDEVDELVRDRGEESTTFFGRLLTTSMLPWLQTLRSRKGDINVFFATNYVEYWDRAIKRPGRIDLMIPVGPPEVCERAKLIRIMINDSLDDTTIITDDEIIDLFSGIDPRFTITELMNAWRHALAGRDSLFTKSNEIHESLLKMRSLLGNPMIEEKEMNKFYEAQKRYNPGNDNV